MHTILKIIHPIWISTVVCTLLTGCASSGRVPEKGPTMAQVYKEAMSESEGETLAESRQQVKTAVNYEGTVNQVAYTRSAQNEINNLFHPLPNPQLSMYVYPHLAENEAPIPGYTTAFYLYEKNHFAMPGEVST